METTTFACSICGEASHRICTFCTKDACGNHLCQRCLRCSDCCLCESPSSGSEEEAEQVKMDDTERAKPFLAS